MKNHFVYKLIPPRPTFAMDMNDAERAIMRQHSEYWRDLLRQGKVLIFGPVLDPAGTWGLAVVEAETAEEARRLGAEDPAVTSRMASFEIYVMPQSVTRS